MAKFKKRQNLAAAKESARQFLYGIMNDENNELLVRIEAAAVLFERGYPIQNELKALGRRGKV